jgi:hypothetical protein
MSSTAQQAKQIYQYKNIKEKLYKSNAAKCYNKLKVKQFHYRPGVAQRVPGI